MVGERNMLVSNGKMYGEAGWRVPLRKKERKKEKRKEGDC